MNYINCPVCLSMYIYGTNICPKCSGIKPTKIMTGTEAFATQPLDSGAVTISSYTEVWPVVQAEKRFKEETQSLPPKYICAGCKELINPVAYILCERCRQFWAVGKECYEMWGPKGSITWGEREV